MKLAIPKVRMSQLLISLLYAAAFIALFWSTFTWMAERFDAADSFYSHGWIIPFASVWLIWRRRASIRQMPLIPSFLGLMLLVPSVILQTLAVWWDVGFVSGFAMVGAVWGLVWTLWGWRTLWLLRFPMLFLLFMVPLPGVLLIATSFKMKLMAAGLATHVLHAMGIAAQQAGSTIHLAGIDVIIDDTCSGLRSLISLIALSTIWISLLPETAKRWHKITIVAASIPIALAANMVRILVLTLLSAIYGPKIADSFIHYGSGLVVFGIAIVILAWVSRMLVKRPSTAVAGAA